MPVDIPSQLAFNRGIISKKAMARVDVERVGLSAEEQTNWMPRVLGSMSLRPGMKYMGTTDGNNAGLFLPFIYSVEDTALFEFTASKLRVWDGDTETPITRPAVTTTIANGAFTSDLTGWTDEDESGAASAWVTGGYMGLTGSGFATAARSQDVAVSAGEQASPVEHALRIVIARGPVTLRVEKTLSPASAYIEDTDLRTGTHSLSFTPTTGFTIRFSAVREYQALVESVAVEASGTLELPTPWGESDLGNIRAEQSRDVVFVACRGYQQRRIERRSTTSFSVVEYAPEDGPFKLENTGPISIGSSALSGDVTLTASSSLFRDGHVGALFQITSLGQFVEATFTAENQFSDPIKVIGVGAQRSFTFIITSLTGTSTTVTMQRSIGEVGAWTDFNSWTENINNTFNDDLDNQIIYYRLAVKTGDYSSGTISVSFEYGQAGTITGYARITAVASGTSASAIVLKALGNTDATTTWAEGNWSTKSGWPTSVCFYEGRLWWFGNDKVWGSISDAFDSFDPLQEGDSGPLNRSIADGPTEVINWALPLQRLLIGGQAATFAAKSSSLDEPLSPAQFSLKRISSQGSDAVAAVTADVNGYYVQKNGKRIYELSQPDARFDYLDADVTALVPEVGSPGIVRLAVQRQPDTRIHCVRSDGKVAVFVIDRAEQVRCWVLVEAGGAGLVEDVVVLPGESEDRVYYLVNRTVNEATLRSLEKWAGEDDAIGGDLTACADSYVEYNGDLTTTVNLAHLEAEEVVVWADGASVDDVNGDPMVFTVQSGTITLPDPAAKIIAGLAYEARYKSAKLAYAAPVGTSLTMRKRIAKIGMLLADTHRRGVQYGPTFDVMDDLPEIENGAIVADDHVWDTYDEDMFTFPGEWDTDTRICLKAASPRPATVLAVPFVIEGHRSF